MSKTIVIYSPPTIVRGPRITPSTKLKSEKFSLFQGDCLQVMGKFPDNSFDSIVTDPPYGISFMGKKWDYDVPTVDVWRECLRVLKPGGHLLAFAGTRTQHRMCCNIEDAGFEIRDMIAWIYGSGFPKSLDVSKAIDKLDASDERRKRDLMFTAWMRSTGITASQINDATESRMGGHYLTNKDHASVATVEMFNKISHLLPDPPGEILQLMQDRTVESENFKRRNVIDERKQRANKSGSAPMNDSTGDTEIITAAATPEAKQWEGWGSALKPALEPISLCRKPLSEKTVAANVLRWGTGGINIGGCRIRDLTGKRPNDTLMETRGEPSWEQGKSLCDSCACLAENKQKPRTQETRGCSAGDSADMTITEKGKTPRVDTNREDTGCFDGMRPESMSTSLSIEEHGRQSTERSKTDLKSTTSAETSSTTESRICDACGNQITYPCTSENTQQEKMRSKQEESKQENTGSVGRFPANLIHDGSPEVLAVFPETGASKSGGKAGWQKGDYVGGEKNSNIQRTGYDEAAGSAARFFYTAKVSKSERGKGNSHPTVKPVKLMQYLCKLITPPSGIVLDPFMGSGSTGIAAISEGFKFTGIERNGPYFEIAKQRITPIEKKLDNLGVM